MNRRQFLERTAFFLFGGASLVAAGCRGHQYAQVLHPGQKDMVGSHCAGKETYEPLIEEAVGKLLSRQAPTIQQAGLAEPAPKRICFVSVENRSAEELGDFKDAIFEIIDTSISQSQVFQPITHRYVEAGLRQLHLRPDDLFLPPNQRQFQAVMEQNGQPFDYLLFATVNSGTTRSNKDYQRDYLLTMDLVNIHTGVSAKECATVRKGYYKSCASTLLKNR